MGNVCLIIYGKTCRNKGKLTQFVTAGLQRFPEVTEHHFFFLLYFTHFQTRVSSVLIQPLPLKQPQCGCPFFLQPQVQTQHLVSCLRQEGD